MKKALKFIMIVASLLLCLALMSSCTDNGADAEASDTTAESTSAQTSAATSDTESETTDAGTSSEDSSADTTDAETEKGGVRPGTDSVDGWEEFEPM